MSKTTFYARNNIVVTIHPNIGLDASTRQSAIKMLNLILADEAVLSLAVSRAEGHELQALYDKQHQQIGAITAEIGERIQILGDTPVTDLQDLIDLARLDGERKSVPGIIDLLADHEALTRFLRDDIQKCFEIYEDLGTFTLLIDVMRSHEKMAWMLRSNITGEQFQNAK